MWMKDMFVLFLSLALGYALCIVAKKQHSPLKTLGYTLGIAIIALSLTASAVESTMKYMASGKIIYGPKAMKCYPGTNLSK